MWRTLKSYQRWVYKHPTWRFVREKAIVRAEYKCEQCRRGGQLHVHHIQPLSSRGAPFTMANLQVLCRKCHKEAHGKPIPTAQTKLWTNYMEQTKNAS